MTQVGLGTAQIGMSYGISNSSPNMDEKSAFILLETALRLGCSYIDTAPSYGMAEERVGSFFSANNSFANECYIASKIPSAGSSDSQSDIKYQEFVDFSVKNSVQKIPTPQFKSIFFHQSDLSFLRSSRFRTASERLIDIFGFKEVGVSVYNVEEAWAALENSYINTIQIPLNILDHRFLDKKLTQAFKEKGIRIISRSVYLQGILCMPRVISDVKKTKELSTLVSMLRLAANGNNIGLQKLALDFIFKTHSDLVDTCIIGFQNISELLETVQLISAKDYPTCEEKLFHDAYDYCDNHQLFDPSTWNTPRLNPA